MSGPSTQLQVETVPIGEVFLSPSNPRHNDEAVPHVEASLRRFGWQQPLVVKPSGEVIAGNTRLKAAQRLGMTEVPIVRFAGSELDATAFGIADNRTSEFASWDDGALASLLQKLREEDALDGVGYSDSEVDELLATTEGGLADDSEDPGEQDPPEEAVSRPGDTWRLGEHRLRCGDSASADEVADFLGGEQAQWVWTDPPYGVSYVGKTADALTIENDGAAELPDFLAQVFAALDRVMAPGCPIYVAHPAGALSVAFATAFVAAGWHLHETLVWVKNTLVLGHSDYHYRHEPVLYGWKGKGRPWFGGRSQDSIFEVDRPQRSENHPTTKPVELVVAMLRNSAAPGSVGFEPFSGSGSTLMAAQQLGLRCRAMELAPRYVDAAVLRWQIATGEPAILEETGRTFDQTAEARS